MQYFLLLVALVVFGAQAQYEFYKTNNNVNTITNVAASRHFVLFTDSQNGTFIYGHHIPFPKYYAESKTLVLVNVSENVPFFGQNLFADADFVGICNMEQCILCNSTQCEMMPNVNQIYFSMHSIMALTSDGAMLWYRQRGEDKSWQQISSENLLGNSTRIRTISARNSSPLVYAIGRNFFLYNISNFAQVTVMNTSVVQMTHNNFAAIILFQDRTMQYISFRENFRFVPEQLGLVYNVEKFAMCSGFVMFLTGANRLYVLGQMTSTYTAVSASFYVQTSSKYLSVETPTFSCDDNTIVFPKENKIVLFGNLFELDPVLLVPYIIGMIVMQAPVLLMVVELICAALCCFRGFACRLTMCVGTTISVFFVLSGVAAVILFVVLGNTIADPFLKIEIIPITLSSLFLIQMLAILGYLVFVCITRKTYFKPHVAISLLLFVIICLIGHYALIITAVIYIVRADYYASTGFNAGALLSYIILKIPLYFMLLNFYNNTVHKQQREKDEFVLQLLDAKADEMYNNLQDENDMNANLTVIDFKELSQFEELGSGAQGIVMKAKWRSDWVAVKLFRKRFAEDEDAMASFKHEANLLCTLRHKNIVNIYGIIMEHPRMGIVMEFCVNGRLSMLIQKRVFQSDEEKIDMLSQIAHGMSYLHHMGVIHRDLKSDNILVDKNCAKIADFGTSKKQGTQNMTMMVGTSVYIAPEVVSSKQYDTKADVYSFAIIMYEVLFDTIKPYADKLVFNIEQEVASNPNMRPSVPTERKYSSAMIRMIELMQSCWNHDPNARPTFDDMIRDYFTTQ